MTRYRYLIVRPFSLRKGGGLREGDEIKAADGKSWLSPIRPAGLRPAPKKGYGLSFIADVWTDTKPGYGPPDLQLYVDQKVKIRRPVR